jgi:hypothetical protein
MSVERAERTVVPDHTRRNQFRHARAIGTPLQYREGQWRSYEPRSIARS